MGEGLVSCNFPAKIGAGLTFDLLLTLTAYPAPAWAVSVYLRGPSSISMTAAAEGSQHRFRQTLSETANWATGDYWYTLRAVDAATGDMVEVENGQVTITPDLVNAAVGFDGRTPNQIALDAIEAVIAQRATLDQERYRINNRELYRTSIPDLLKLRDHYVRLVKREQDIACGRNPFGNTVRVRLR
ncbi:hypothetical protein [Aeromonas caviae]|uniref:Uncharacterized protein n=1 Tax=Aeromonas caviae TaxID=648 RepID=A0AAW9EZZ7_AERCA|nr:hypothetical protein [Aeromonas caviae]MDX7718952.1 hypothetical protein [Aeromonas caviae]